MEAHVRTKRKQNPKENANPLNVIFFIYMIPIFRKFYKQGVTEDNLYDVLSEHKASTLGIKLEKLWAESNIKHKKAPLFFALFRQFGLELVIWVFIHSFCFLQTILFLPIGINGLVLHFQKISNKETVNDAYYYSAILFCSILIRVIGGHSSIIVMCHICMKMRVACCSLIYRKALKLSALAVSQTTIGQIVNLLSNDVSKFDQGLALISNVIIGPGAIVIAIQQQLGSVGISVFSGISFLLLFIFLQMFLGKQYSRIRLKIAGRTDERLKLLNEIFSGINVVKMYTWEVPFGRLVSLARRYEINTTRSRLYVESIRNAMEIFVTRTSIFITIVLVVFLNGSISANKIFFLTATYTTLRLNVGYHLPAAINSLAEAVVTIKRIQSFLQYEEIGTLEEVNTPTKNSKVIEGNLLISPKVFMSNVYVKWVEELPNYALQKIDLNIDRNQLVALIGPVGSGKSTLLNVLLKELAISDGVVDVCGKISFASQESWLFTSSIRQNIVFGNEFNEERYKTVLNVCALDEDLNTFPYGDLTLISESGKSLSGGQRTRINLARCIYREADVYLLDDPLSAVDVEVGQYLYKQCIQQFLNNKICILVTHQLQYLKSADNIVIMDKGCIIGQGTYKMLQKSGLNFATLLKEFSRDDKEEKIAIDNIKIKEVLNKTETKDAMDRQKSNIKEKVQSGSVGLDTYLQYFKSGGGYCLIFCLIASFAITQFLAIGGDYYVSYLSKSEEVRNFPNSTTNTTLPKIENRTIYVYSGLIALTIIFSFGHGIFFVIFATHASENLHNTIFQKILCATMRFFDLNPTGRILNRFSNDVGVVDAYIPVILMEVMKLFFMIIQVFLAFAIINHWHILPFIALLVPVYFSQKFYVRTSNGTKRVEAMTRSPIFNHMAATIQGLRTIRAFGAQNKLVEEFDDHQDLHSSAFYLFIASSRAYALWVDFISTCFMATEIICFLIKKEDYDSGKIGFMLTQYIFFNMAFSYIARQICELENYMVSVERVLDYAKVETEHITTSIKNLPTHWPENGKIVFENVTMKYIHDTSAALKNLNFTIFPKDKIGIVGRTGAGKSSIIAALFQMYNTEGSIFIDNVDVTKIPLKDLRSKISIIPQQPVLFSGSLRKNLDPVEEYDDSVLWDALEKVELKEFVDKSVGGLSTAVQQFGSNFSIGQKQLICFARAIIRKNKILIMDEATANVDPYTDSVIQKTIRQTFVDCTVITIAHRLHTIIDCNKILVMDNGCAIEFDTPFNLLQTKNSLFYKLLQAAGKDTVDNFHAVAEKNFRKTQ